MRTEYDSVFLGCSCFAMGCAAQRPEDSLILESGEGFGPEFVDALRACDTDEVMINLNGPVAPAVIVPPDGSHYLYLILPVRPPKGNE